MCKLLLYPEDKDKLIVYYSIRILEVPMFIYQMAKYLIVYII